MPYTDSNFGNIFSFWDRFFGTYMHLNPKKIIYGVDKFFIKEENEKITKLLYRPFEKSRS
jgi:sterol desaturase/sphingolipid hydroxylase (fatty acid hydroxylase superfamily)